MSSLAQFYHIDTMAEFENKKRSANASNTEYYTGEYNESTSTKVSGTPDLPWNSICFIKDTGSIYFNLKMYGYIDEEIMLSNVLFYKDDSLDVLIEKFTKVANSWPNVHAYGVYKYSSTINPVTILIPITGYYHATTAKILIITGFLVDHTLSKYVIQMLYRYGIITPTCSIVLNKISDNNIATESQIGDMTIIDVSNGSGTLNDATYTKISDMYTNKIYLLKTCGFLYENKVFIITSAMTTNTLYAYHICWESDNTNSLYTIYVIFDEDGWRVSYNALELLSEKRGITTGSESLIKSGQLTIGNAAAYVNINPGALQVQSSRGRTYIDYNISTNMVSAVDVFGESYYNRFTEQYLDYNQRLSGTILAGTTTQYIALCTYASSGMPYGKIKIILEMDTNIVNCYYFTWEHLTGTKNLYDFQSYSSTSAPTVQSIYIHEVSCTNGIRNIWLIIPLQVTVKYTVYANIGLGYTLNVAPTTLQPNTTGATAYNVNTNKSAYRAGGINSFIEY